MERLQILFTLLALLTFPLLLHAEGGSSSISILPDRDEVEAGGIFLEPMLFTSQGASSIRTQDIPMSRNDTSASTSARGLGMKLGVHAFESLLLGVDARYAWAGFAGSFYGSAEGASYSYGPTLALQTPFFGVRVLGTYVLGGDFNPGSGSSGFDVRFKNSNGFRLGAGIFIAGISLNMEYQKLVHSSAEIQSFGTLDLENTAALQYTDQAYTLSLSFPVEL